MLSDLHRLHCAIRANFRLFLFVLITAIAF